MVTKTPFSLLLALCLCLLTACGGDVEVKSLASAKSNKNFNVNPLASIPTNNPPATSIPEDTNSVAYSSLTAASADTSNNVDKTFTLQALAVYKNDVSDYERGSGATNWDNAKIEQKVTLAHATSPVLSLTFNPAGEMAAVTAYFASKTYQSVLTNGPISDTLLIGTIGASAATGATTTTMMADRRADFFGFAPKYMVHVSWNLAKETHSLASTGTDDSIFEDDGSMIAGIETVTIPTIGTTDFSGKGKGKYGDIRTGYATIFDIVAKVDFARFITISSSNTMRCENNSSQFGTCVQIAESALDFSGSTTNLTKEISGSVVATDLFGRFNARFYGNIDGGANELGGTFAMVSSGNDRYYYGAFGGERANIFITGKNQFTIDALTVKQTLPDLRQGTNIPIDSSSIAYMSLTAASADSMNNASKTFILQGLAVHKDDSRQYNRASNAPNWDNANISRKITLPRITLPALSIGFAVTSEIEAVTAYFDDKTYIANISSGTSSASKLSGIIGADSIGAPTGASRTVMMADRSKDFFGYNLTSNYMVYVNWLSAKDLDVSMTGFTQDTYHNHGVMIAGMETNATIPTTGTLLFEGKGRGYYANNNGDDYATIFNMVADVDFTMSTVNLQTLSTMSCSDETNISTCTASADALDFTANGLSFLDSNTNMRVNAISGMASIGDLTGVVDARFYGEKFEEFGGTFALRNSSSYYYGAFGGYNFGFTNVVTSGTITNPRPANSVSGYQSFDEVSAGDVTLPSVAVHYTKTATTTNLERIATSGDDSSAVKITFDAGRNITTARTYFADQSYGLTPATATAKQIIHDNTMSDITAEVTLISTATNIDLQLTRADSTIYGFEAKYVMIGWWRIENATGDRNDGNMVVGFETATSGLNGIPIEGNVTFTGGSIGVYNSDSESQNFQTKSSIAVNVDFVTRKVNLTSNATFSCVTINNCATAMPALNFSTADNTAPKYETGKNNISAAIVTTDGGMPSRLKGRFDARFYGNNAAELGGTFIMQSADEDKYYMGSFITNR
ncbi:MAG: transferrin-binding protein-like solute binding protein [Alphaproteobacteria bacterium]|nr:transferrin-binding protein-like solute binding protein [Alphaproteobacteria bacterium]